MEDSWEYDNGWSYGLDIGRGRKFHRMLQYMSYRASEKFWLHEDAEFLGQLNFLKTLLHYTMAYI